MRRKYTFLENVAFLALVGILAGALGGLAVGVVTGRAPSPTSATAGK